MFGKRALSCSDCAIITFAVFLYFFFIIFFIQGSSTTFQLQLALGFRLSSVLLSPSE